MTKVAVRAPAPWSITFDGQSLNLSPLDYPFPDQMMNRFFPGIPWRTVAVNNTGWFTLINTFATRVKPHARPANRGTDVLLMNGGTTDLGSANTAAQIYAKMVEYKDLALANGFDKVVVNTIPEAVSGGVGAIWLQKQSDTNDLILANSGGFDAVVDVATPLGSTPGNPYFDQVDQIHLALPGAALFAELWAPALEGIL